MKFIGQYIQSLIARFRNDVYLEDISTGTIASGSNLGLDSNNKIVKAAEATGDITGVTAGTNLTGGGDSGAVTINLADASTSAKGAASFSSDNFAVADGAVTIKDAGIDLSAEVTSRLPVANGGTGAASLTDGGILLGSGTAAVTATSVLGDGEILIGDGTTDPVALDVGSSTAITVLGTVGTGVWQGTAIASAYLDSDTAHYSAQRQLTYYMMQDDIDTTKIYISLQESDAESATATNKNLPILAPFAGKLLKVFLRANTDLSGRTLTWRLETQAAGSATSTTPTIVGTQSGAGCTASSMTTYDFTTSLDSGDNIIDAGDTVQLSIQSNGTTANTKFYITCLWEWNLS
tara:strand:+ start:2646 stop:3692 length:1047 start_codon:yes stop_codon:yes gene_type:complete